MTASPEHQFIPETPAHQLLRDPQIQNGLRTVFADLDNLYNGIKTQTPYMRKAIGTPSITPSGNYIEASWVATPHPPKGDPQTEENTAQWQAYHASKELLVFAFNLADLRDPSFQLRPITIDKERVVEYRGGGIDVVIPDPSDPEPPIPTFDGTNLGTASEQMYIHDDWEERNKLHLPQRSHDDPIRYRDEVAEPFKKVREAAGVTL